MCMKGNILMMDQDKISAFLADFFKDLSYVRKVQWNYEDACILLAAIQLYEATNDSKYRQYVLDYLDHYIDPEGIINTFKKYDYNLDNLAMGRVVIFAYEQTNEERFFKAMHNLLAQIQEQPRTKSGNFWHKKIYPNQIWLDGLFMAQPFYMAYETKFGVQENYQDIVRQFNNVKDYMFDENEGLYYHGFDESREVFWANEKTGLSKNFWLRSIAWFLMGIVDTMEEISNPMDECFKTLAKIYEESIRGILRYQDENSKMFYQLVNLLDVKGNYFETSGTVMIAASILKACRMKVIPTEYRAIGEEILRVIIEEKLHRIDDKLILKDTCKVAGLGPHDNLKRDGSIEYYLTEPIGNNDLKGVAALFMAYAQYLKISKCL